MNIQWKGIIELFKYQITIINQVMKKAQISRKIIVSIFSIIIILGFQSCQKLFEYSPYSANVENDQLNTNAIQLNGISDQFKNPSKFSFAVIADVHFHYTSLATIINQINHDHSIDFVIVAGDISDQALLKEYELFYDIMKDLDKPYLTVIGNHDYNANGENIYAQMFGAKNLDFYYQNSHFILFDDVFWESNRTPNFNWLAKTIEEGTDYEHQFVITHLPPFSDQFDISSEELYVKLMKENDIRLSIHGHTHSYLYEDFYEDGIPYLVVPYIKDPQYVKVSIDQNNVSHELVKM